MNLLSDGKIGGTMDRVTKCIKLTVEFILKNRFVVAFHYRYKGEE